MPNRRKIDPYEAAKLVDGGMSIEEAAKKYGMTPSGVYQALRAIGYEHKKQRSHKKWLPWPLAEEHRQSDVATYIRRLSVLTDPEGQLQSLEKDHLTMAKSVLSWGVNIVDAFKDYDYDPEEPPNEFSRSGGFYLKEADPDHWRIKRLVAEVRRVQSRIR